MTTLITGKFKNEDRQTIEGYQLHFIAAPDLPPELWMTRSNDETLYGSRVLRLQPDTWREEISPIDHHTVYIFDIPLAALQSAHNTLERYIETSRQSKGQEGGYVEREPVWMTTAVKPEPSETHADKLERLEALLGLMDQAADKLVGAVTDHDSDPAKYIKRRIASIREMIQDW